MTLRLRLVLAIVALVTLGLGAFGYVTYQLYARSQYDRLDDQLRSAAPILNGQLARAAGLDSGPGGFGVPSGAGSSGTTGTSIAGASTATPGAGNVPPGLPMLPLAAFAELRDGNGAVVQTILPSSGSSQPVLPTPLPVVGAGGSLLFTTASVDGGGEWRVLVVPSDRPRGFTVVSAVPLTEVSASLNRLVLIEGAAAVGLLTIIAIGSWLILRTGLQPLEHMADTARSITAGDLSQRVEPADERSEVGQLGLALNTMLGELEVAFDERDATELRLRQFLADASHELRTPLTSIQGFAELFRLGADQEHVDLEVLPRRIEEEAARMKVLVEDLLLLARLDETRPVLRVPVDLAVLAADACTDAVALDAARPVTLDAPEPVVVLGEQDHLRQAIGNLVVNAVRHTPPGTAVEVGARLEGGQAVVTVRDHGHGLDDEARAHVFDRFWRADEARVGSGTGLGLAIVAGIAAEHAGVVEADNHPDGGARFTLRLPLAGSAV
jgi:two-component system OmpR family sensor kinase